MKIFQKRSESSEIRKWIIDLAFLALMIFFFYDWKVAKKYECCIIPKDFISVVTGSDNTSFNQIIKIFIVGNIVLIIFMFLFYQQFKHDSEKIEWE